MNIDLPWVKDDLRDKPNERKGMFDSFMNALIENDKKFELISGNFDERKQKAITSIENLLNFT
jgi:nicotinamide riboside kinase